MADRELRKLLEEMEMLKRQLAAIEHGTVAGWHQRLGQRFVDRKAAATLLLAAIAIPLAAVGASVSIPYTFTNGTPADANQVNANFDALVLESNDQDARIAALEASVGQIPLLSDQVTTNSSNISALQTAVDTNTGNVGLLSAYVAAINADLTNIHVDIDSIQADLVTGGDLIATNTADIATNATSISDLSTTFAGVTRGGSPDTLTFSGMNVQVVDGTGDTDGAENGLGNLIVGYNESPGYRVRTGSHNLVVGMDHSYTSYGGFVAGVGNTISGHAASVTGGAFNEASGTWSTVAGGTENTAAGAVSSIAGGQFNSTTALSTLGTITGGSSNMVSADHATVTGGYGNAASHVFSVVSGGQNVTTSADYDIGPLYGDVVDNSTNVASNTANIAANAATVAANSASIATNASDIAGNAANIVANSTNIDSNALLIGTLESTFAGVSRGGTPDTLIFSGMNIQLVSGSGGTGYATNGLGNLIVGYNEDLTSPARGGSHNLVVGGEHEYTGHSGIVSGLSNSITADNASVVGGYQNTASGAYSSVLGGHQNIASGPHASVSGGYQNTATGTYASVTGGASNDASGESSSVSGGHSNEAQGRSSSISGGLLNAAKGSYSSVSGGQINETGADYSSISGGEDNYAGETCWSGANAGNRCASDADCPSSYCPFSHSQSVTGGEQNRAIGNNSTVSGGRTRATYSPHYWAAGSLIEGP